jgi:hypothetical protein
MPNGEKDRLFTRHLLLVIVLVAALLITEGLVFGFMKNTADFKDILALTFGTFGAWIGAGAAYFFGRENLKSATDSMLQISGKTPGEILSKTKIKDMNPRTVKTLRLTDPVVKALEWVQQEIKKYLIAIVNEDNKFVCAISDEAVITYAYAQLKDNKDINTGNQTLNDLVEYFKQKQNTNEDCGYFIKYAVQLDENMTVAEANAAIEKGDTTYIGVILNAQKQPVGYLTTNDIRKLLVHS